MTIDPTAEQQIDAALRRYCTAFDDAQFDAFAALFDRGRWFMVTEPGSGPVRDWIDRHVVLYDGRPLTRHQTTGLTLTGGAHAGEVAFRCGLTIWQQLPGAAAHLLARARFTGTFRRFDDGWWWHEHAMEPDETGDLSTHIRGGLAASPPPDGPDGTVAPRVQASRSPSRRPRTGQRASTHTAPLATTPPRRRPLRGCSMPELIVPTTALHQEWLRAHHEWPGEHQDGSGLTDADEIESADGFTRFVTRLQDEADEAKEVPAGRVHCSYWWITEDRKVVGAIALRHELNDFLREAGGHVGYSVRPSSRRRGFASWALSQTVRRAAAMGISPVLVSCAVDNEASRRTIEAAGGVLEDVRDTALGRVQRFWITS